MGDVKVSFEATPNPNAGKFVVNRTLVEGGGSRSVTSREEAAGDDLSEALLALPGVESLFYADDFVTVTKGESASWEELIPLVSRALRTGLE